MVADARIYSGQYAQPSAPRISTTIASPGVLATPFLTLDTPPLTVEASNGTVESPTGSPVYFNQPCWYDPGAPFNPPIQESLFLRYKRRRVLC